MTYDERVIVEFVEKRLKKLNSERKLVVPTMGCCLLALIVCLIWLLYEESEQVGEWLVSKPLFLDGFAFGILAMVSVFLAAAGFVKVFRVSWGIEGAVYELAARLGRERLKQA